ncbi:RNA polymerase sigma factor [Streptomyces sp. AP-93]|uniref:RNA polymerase sigma factor n=1 Tax=Streptomyces sp. AP-93 TaxID=2929048 RepID=UPI001FAF3D2A|nr:RNA polymerase sigma factor [Streptomyces sp. AP-93]MCJ0870294.1 RNA polymerase sigma factor [Streptomyces sp. AP-93]
MLGDDAELTTAVLAAQDGDELAFRSVYRAVHPRLLGYVRTLVGDGDAEDVTSEAWLQIARDLDSFTGDADRFRGWAARIARNRALDHIRMRGRRPAVGGDETELTGHAAESDTAGEAMESLSTCRTMELIAQLPQDQAEAVVLRVVVGLDAKSAAETLGKRPGAVRTAAHRGLKKLAELLHADEDFEPDSGPDSGPESGPGSGPGSGAGSAVGVGSGRRRGLGDNDASRARGAGDGRDLDAVPAQRARAAGLVEQTGVTHSRWRTQKDM